VLPEVPDDIQLLKARLRAARFDFLYTLLLLFGGKLEALQFLPSARKFRIDNGSLALELLERGREILPPRLDRTKERGKCQAPDIRVVRPLLFTGNAIIEVLKLAVGIAAHFIERRQAALQVVNAKALGA